MNTSKATTVLALAALLSIVGCASTKPTSFYLLQPVTAGTPGDSIADRGPSRVLGVGPIELPRYLNRPQIVTRGTANRLEVAEFARWAEPLQDNVTRVLGENLAMILPADRIELFPWERGGSPDFQVTVQMSRFDGTLGADSTLVARWQILASATGETLLTRKSTFSVAASAAGHAGIVAAMNRALEALSRDIGEALRATRQASIPRHRGRFDSRSTGAMRHAG